MLRSLNSGVTGLLNHQVRMDVIGNNISNVNTVGFKNGRVTFSESFSQMVKGASRSASKAGGTNPMQIGLGVKVGAVDTIVTQGSLNNTNRVFDLAIEGNAFFGVSDGVGTYYTRNGAFQLDSEGYIILPTNGMVLQGRMADAYGNFPPGTAIGNMKIPMTQMAPAKETTFVELGKNLPMDGDAKGQVSYTQRFLHPADGFRIAGGNGTTDAGRSITSLESLFTANGDALNIKDGDVLTFSWTSLPSEASVGNITYEINLVVKDPRDENPPRLDWSDEAAANGTTTPYWDGNTNRDNHVWMGESQGPGGNVNYVWSLEDLKNALQAAVSGNSKVSATPIGGQRAVGYYDPSQANGINTQSAISSRVVANPGEFVGSYSGLEIELDANGSLTMKGSQVYNPTYDPSLSPDDPSLPWNMAVPKQPLPPFDHNNNEIGSPNIAIQNYYYKEVPPVGHVFSPVMQTSNPKGESIVPATFKFGNYAGPGMGNYSFDPVKGMSTGVMLRPAEQFDVLDNIRTANGSRLGLESGDPIDLNGAIGAININNTKSGALMFNAANSGYWNYIDPTGAFGPPPPFGFNPNDPSSWPKAVSDNPDTWPANFPVAGFVPTNPATWPNNFPIPGFQYNNPATWGAAAATALGGFVYNNPSTWPANFPAVGFGFLDVTSWPDITVPTAGNFTGALWGILDDSGTNAGTTTLNLNDISTWPAATRSAFMAALGYDYDRPATWPATHTPGNFMYNNPATWPTGAAVLNGFVYNDASNWSSLSTPPGIGFPNATFNVEDFTTWPSGVIAGFDPGDPSTYPTHIEFANFNPVSGNNPMYWPWPADYSNLNYDPYGGTPPVLPGGLLPFDGLDNWVFNNTQTLMDDFMAKIRNDFILPPDYVDRDGVHYPSVSMNGTDGDSNMPYGAIVLRSMKGKDFAINRMSVSAENSNRNNIAPTAFVQNSQLSKLRDAVDPAPMEVTQEVFDSSGAPHVLTISFVHTGRAGEWEWKASFAGKEDIVPGTGSGKVFFGQDGCVSAWVFDGGGSQLQVDPHNGASMMSMDLNVGGPGDYRGLTQYNSDFSAIVKGQDGYGSGALVEISIDEFGVLEGAFSNGTNRVIGQIMLVDFANPGGLLDLSDCIFTVSANSGDPVWGKPMSQSASAIKPGALEMSNVDLGTEFTNMITTQRGYQANSRIVTVSDSMLEELVNLKR